jgi:F5/8 type C domain-containing protein
VPEVVEPGTRLVERYRLVERLDGAAGHDGTTYWRAEDELLARPVGVCLIDLGSEDDTRAAEVLAAARRAAALPDSRFLRVLDASQVDGHVYVVSEWVAATDLAGLVSDGPLPAAEARSLAADLAAAMTAAHADGLAHLCLGPDNVLRTPHGQLKLAGLAVDAAARGQQLTGNGTTARSDVHGIGAVLYAALTGRWPGHQQTSLPPAPMADDAVCTPRQVRAGVPHDLDEIVCRALGLPARRTDAFRTPGEMLAALDSAGHTSRLPAVSREPTPERRDDYRSGAVAAYGDGDGDGSTDTEGGSRSRAVWAAWVLAAIVLVTGLSLFGGQVVMTALDGGDEQGQAASGDDGGGGDDAEGPPVRRLDVTRVRSFDPPPGDGEEHDEQAPLVADGDPATAWTTMTYFDPINLLKPGVGLVLDLGKAADVSEVVIRPGGGPTDLDVRVAERRASTLDGYTEFDRTGNATGPTTLRVDEPVRARYVLVWLTDLPPVGSDYVGEISEITIRGTAASGG